MEKPSSPRWKIPGSWVGPIIGSDGKGADTSWRFWGLYGHICKLETLHAAYALAKANDGAPGIDGETFEAIEREGVERFLEQLRDELVSRTYRPLRNRRVAISKDGGQVRVLGVPAIRDRVVQGALTFIMEPVFEAAFCDGSYGYRPKRTAHQAVDRVAPAIVQGKTRVLDVDPAANFDAVRPDLRLGEVARRVQDPEILHVLKRMLKASGKRGVPQGGVLSPLLSNISLTAVDKMLGRVYEVRHTGGCPWGRGGVPDDLGLHGDAQVALLHLGRVARVRGQMGRGGSDLGEQSGLAHCRLVLPWGTGCASKRDPTPEPSTCSPSARLKAPRGEFLAPSTWRIPRRRRSLSPTAPDLGLFSTHLPVESSGNVVALTVR